MIRIQKTTPLPSTLNNERTYEQLQIILDKNGFDNDKEKGNYRKLCRSDRIYNALCETYHHKCAFCESASKAAYCPLPMHLKESPDLQLSIIAL